MWMYFYSCLVALNSVRTSVKNTNWFDAITVFFFIAIIRLAHANTYTLAKGEKAERKSDKKNRWIEPAMTNKEANEIEWVSLSEMPQQKRERKKKQITPLVSLSRLICILFSFGLVFFCCRWKFGLSKLLLNSNSHGERVHTQSVMSWILHHSPFCGQSR